MKKKLLLTFGALCIANLGYAQVQLDDYISKVGDAVDPNKSTMITFQKTEVEGNPLLFDQFVMGVLKKGRTQTIPVLMNFDLANNRIIVDQDNRIIAIDNSAVSVIDINSLGMTFKNGYDTGGKDDLNRNSFFQVIYEGENYSVLKHSGVSYQEDVSSYGTATKTDVFVRYSEFYYMKDGEFDGLSSRSRRFFRIFGDDRNAVEKYVNENDLDIKADSDLAAIFSYADSL